MNPYEVYLSRCGCNSMEQFFIKLNGIAKTKMNLDEMPFSLSALKYPPGGEKCPEVVSFIHQCFKIFKGNNSDAQAANLVEFLKNNPPEVSYKSPKFAEGECTQDEKDLMQHILLYGIELPGSKYNPFGHLQYFSQFFKEIFFGNYTEFYHHVHSLPVNQLEQELKKREGYCKFSPIFASILGLRLVHIEYKPIYTKKEVIEIKKMFFGYNKENKHLTILEELLKLGANPNACDINGFTPLHYAVVNLINGNGMMKALLKHGADPNSESRDGTRPLTILKDHDSSMSFEMIGLLVEHGAKLTTKEHVNQLRYNVENNGNLELLMEVREAMPREKGECEFCLEFAIKMCSACGLVYYCTPVCQKMDWKIHKGTCRKNSHRNNNC